MINILVLEDDAVLNKSVCTYLNDSGFTAKGFLNANNAYDAMNGGMFDLIISDIMMPGIDGFDSVYVGQGRSACQAEGIPAGDRRLHGKAH